jgi:hypothetical protein
LLSADERAMVADVESHTGLDAASRARIRLISVSRLLPRDAAALRSSSESAVPDGLDK